MIVDRDVLKARIGFREDVELLQAVFLEELLGAGKAKAVLAGFVGGDPAGAQG
jgi:hypothetical protein